MTKPKKTIDDSKQLAACMQELCSGLVNTVKKYTESKDDVVAVLGMLVLHVFEKGGYDKRQLKSWASNLVQSFEKTTQSLRKHNEQRLYIQAISRCPL